MKHLLSVQHTIFFTFNFINAKAMPDRTQQIHGGYHSGLQQLFSILLHSLLLYYHQSNNCDACTTILFVT